MLQDYSRLKSNKATEIRRFWSSPMPLAYDVSLSITEE